MRGHQSKLCPCSLLHFIFCWLHWISLVVVILEVDALEGVACYYLNNFAVLELIFLSNRDIDKCFTDVLTLRPACADPLVVEIVVAVEFSTLASISIN